LLQIRSSFPSPWRRIIAAIMHARTHAGHLIDL
jgi:hypothetical protein